jgi:hypothetical protein
MADEAPDDEAEYAPVEGATIAANDLSEKDTIIQIMHWIGFNNEAIRNRIIDDSIGSYDDIRMLSETDITSMTTDWSSRNPVNQRISFGTRRTKLMKALTHWMQDFYRISLVPTISGDNEATFKSQLLRALARADIRKNFKDNTSTAADAADPGPLKLERDWKQWEEKFVNYAGTHLGAHGIPLSYVIRENDNPNHNGLTLLEYPDFMTMTVDCAPLQGEYYAADKLTVFKMLVSFTTGQPSGDWIKGTLRYADGRRSMKSLRDHFAGEGNATRNKAAADRLKDSLHYKSERAMTFESFLTGCQKMFNIYEKEAEPMTDDAKTRFLFKQVQHAGLRGAIEALKAQQTAGVNVTYTMAANHLSTAVSELPEFISKNRNISAIGTGSGRRGSDDIYNNDGTINTGHIPTWRQLSPEDRDIVNEERNRLRNKSGKGNQNKSGNKSKEDSNRLNQLSAQNKKFKRQIKAMKRMNKVPDTNANSNTKDDNDSDTGTDAGDQFGGRASKKKKT